MGLVLGKFLFSAEIREIIIVCPYFKRFRVAFKVVAESFECVNDCEEFFIVDIVVLFHGLE